jgi:hypothetical protein
MEGLFAVHTMPLLKRRFDPGMERLTNPEDDAWNQEHTDAVLEILMETHSHAGNMSRNAQVKLRRMLGYYLVKQAKFFAINAKESLVRRRAMEALVYWPKGKTGLKVLLGLLSPALLRLIYKARKAVLK